MDTVTGNAAARIRGSHDYCHSCGHFSALANGWMCQVCLDTWVEQHKERS